MWAVSKQTNFVANKPFRKRKERCIREREGVCGGSLFRTECTWYARVKLLFARGRDLSQRVKRRGRPEHAGRLGGVDS